MSYSVKSTKKRDYEAERVMEIQRKGKRFPKFNDVTQTATENVSGVTEQKHEKNQIIQYKGKIGVVKKNTKKGVLVNLGDSDNFTDAKHFQEVEIPQKEYDKHAEPIFIPFPIAMGYPIGVFRLKR